MLVARLIGTNVCIEATTFRKIVRVIEKNYLNYEKIAHCPVDYILQFGEKEIVIVMKDTSNFVYIIGENNAAC